MTSVTASSAAVAARLPVPPPLTSSSGVTRETAPTTAARRERISRAEVRCIARIAKFRTRLRGVSSPTPAMWPS